MKEIDIFLSINEYNSSRSFFSAVVEIAFLWSIILNRAQGQRRPSEPIQLCFGSLSVLALLSTWCFFLGGSSGTLLLTEAHYGVIRRKTTESEVEFDPFSSQIDTGPSHSRLTKVAMFKRGKVAGFKWPKVDHFLLLHNGTLWG